MRSLSVIASIAACATLASIEAHRAIASEQFPYTAYANSDDVYIRSGPGKNYYPTDKLPRGEAVEVYRHDPGGWYAVRPPEGSFSWVQADALKPVGDRVAVVEKDQAMCYVGTRFSNAHDVHQLRLDKGEQVEILDVKQVGEGPDAQSWCQIAPPSGEFRWVFGKFVDRTPPTGLSRRRNDDGTSGRNESSDESPKSRDAIDRSAQHTGWTAKGGGGTASSADPSMTGSTKRDSTWRPVDGKRAGDEKSIAVVADPFQAELDAIDLEVSKMASDEPTAWEFTGLRRRAEGMVGRADTALERGRVRLVLNRIARFEDVKRRNELLNPQTNAIAVVNRPTSALPAAAPVAAAPSDAVGKLTPVVSQRPNAPQYALVDRTNQVVSFISPAPGVDLQQFVGKEVGVSGQRGYMPELRKPHVTAMRVNVIDEGAMLR